MGSDAELLRPSDNLDGPELPIHQQIQRVLVDAIEGAELGTAAVLEQFEGNMPDAQAVRSCTLWQLPLAQAHSFSRGISLCRRRSLSRSAALHVEPSAEVWRCPARLADA